MSVNVARLRKELEFITAHRDLWNQRMWIVKRENECGTAGCLAGWTVLHEEGVMPVWRGAQSSHIEVDGKEEYIAAFASDLLGIEDYEDALWLFDSQNSLYDLWDKARELSDGEIQIPDDVVAEAYATAGDQP